MPKRALTAITVANAKPDRNKAGDFIRTEVPDPGCRGLRLIIQPSFAKSYAARYRFHGKSAKLTLGPALLLAPGEAEPKANPTIGAALTLSAARALASEALRQVALGIDPAARKKQAKVTDAAARAKLSGDTVENCKAQFIERHAKRQNRSWKQTERIFDQLVLPAWKGRTVHDITRRNVIDLVESIERDRPILANRTLAVVRKWFNWLAARDVVKANPCAGVAPPAKEKSRDRRLTDDEIKALWNACGPSDADGGGGIGAPFGTFVKVLLLTGARRSEVAGLRWSEIDLAKGLWLLPAERAKNGRAHSVPLCRQVRALIDGVDRMAGSDVVLTTTGESGLGGFSRAKERLDKRMKPTAPWTFHDLRRTCATGMADIGIAPHIVEAVLNHASGHRGGIAGVYNRAQYAGEKAEALQRWADHVERLVTGAASATVVPMRGRQR